MDNPDETHQDGEPCALLVEDAPLDQEKFAAILQQIGCHVEIAEDGIEAMNKLDEVTPDLIILDLQMPRMGGIETLNSCPTAPFSP